MLPVSLLLLGFIVALGWLLWRRQYLQLLLRPALHQPPAPWARDHEDEIAERLARLRREQIGRAPDLDPVTNPFVIRTNPDGQQNHYVVLGIAQTASDADIRQAYLEHVRLVHPDRFLNDPERFALAQEKFKRLNIARQALSDPVERAKHDSMLLRQAHWEGRQHSSYVTTHSRSRGTGAESSS